MAVKIPTIFCIISSYSVVLIRLWSVITKKTTLWRDLGHFSDMMDLFCIFSNGSNTLEI